MKSTGFLFLRLLTMAHVGVSQKRPDVSWAELRQTHYEGDSTAPAAILSDVGQLSFVHDDHAGFRVKRTRTVRIKVYTAEAVHRGEVAISYYDGGYRREMVTDIEGVTYNEDGLCKPS